MTPPLTQLLPQLSDALASQVAAAAAMVAAIRVGPNRHIAGIVWRGDMVVTSDQALPAQESYSLAMSNATLLPARAARRDPALNLASLSLDTPAGATHIRSTGEAAAGALALVLGAAIDGSPTVRLTVIHRVTHGMANGHGLLDTGIILDLPGNLVAEGGPVLDARGGLLGMATISPQGEAMVVPYTAIARFLDPLTTMKPQAVTGPRRGWLGIALQPITVPEPLRPVAGQSSGRMVVSITPTGPAEQAGLRLGDVLLAIDGQSVSGQHALRASLAADRIGTLVEVRLMRDGALRTCNMTVAAQPLD